MALSLNELWPEGWDADEATERIRVETHAYPEHGKWLAQTAEGKRIHFCQRCDD